jgi:hypothetical protein
MVFFMDDYKKNDGRLWFYHSNFGKVFIRILMIVVVIISEKKIEEPKKPEPLIITDKKVTHTKIYFSDDNLSVV